MAEQPPSTDSEAPFGSQATTTSTSSSDVVAQVTRRPVPRNRTFFPSRTGENVQEMLSSDPDTDEGDPDSPVPITPSDSRPWRWRLQRPRVQTNAGPVTNHGVPPIFRRCNSGSLCPICDGGPSFHQGLDRQGGFDPSVQITPATSQASTLNGAPQGIWGATMTIPGRLTRCWATRIFSPSAE
jgi:hypothetical protein